MMKDSGMQGKQTKREATQNEGRRDRNREEK